MVSLSFWGYHVLVMQGLQTYNTCYTHVYLTTFFKKLYLPICAFTKLNKVHELSKGSNNVCMRLRKHSLVLHVPKNMFLFICSSIQPFTLRIYWVSRSGSAYDISDVFESTKTSNMFSNFSKDYQVNSLKN